MQKFFLFTALTAVSACIPDFDPTWQVKDLRILAIKADPPEILVPIGTTDFPEIKINALVVDPTNSNALYDWELWACTAEKSQSCLEAKARTLITTDHSYLDEISANFTLSSTLFEAALMADQFKGFGGVPVLIELRVQPSSGLMVSGIKRLVYGTFIPEQKQPNQNPAFEKIQANGNTLLDKITVDPCQDIEFLPVPTQTSKEKYLVATFDNPSTGEELEEFLSYSFFTTDGRFSNATTGGKPSVVIDNKKVEDVKSTWNNCDEESNPPSNKTSSIWIIIRDDRGGINWTSITATIAE